MALTKEEKNLLIKTHDKLTELTAILLGVIIGGGLYGLFNVG